MQVFYSKSDQVADAAGSKNHLKLLYTLVFALWGVTGNQLTAGPARIPDSTPNQIIAPASQKGAFTLSPCPSTPADQNFTGYTNNTYPATITLACMLYSTSGGTGVVGVEDAVAGGISDGPVFSGNALVMTFSGGISPTYADFKSTSNTINFKMASLDVEFFGHSNGNCAEIYNIIGYDNGLVVATVNSFNVKASGTYGTGNSAIVYNRNAYNASGNNTGSLTFGALWANVDEVRFVIADAAPYNNLWVAVDNLNFEPAIVLPVTLSNFTVSNANGKALLKWQTLSEQGIENFMVQNSMDGVNWHDLAMIPAAGNSNSKKDYSYMQSNPQKGTNYYRLLKTDFSGNTNYSDTRILKVEDNTRSFSLLSTSAHECQLQINEPVTLSIFNANGMLVKKTKFAPGVQWLDLNNYAKGLYFIRSKDLTEKIIVR
ncbi:MAG: type sorting protein [Ferruginibacter sp.]|uniref:T9SS type A sorting domain-containing protein n=1 Tax=Ferruginibacter sp. TaxID=1940288 RepID=UPI00265A44A9|nr:T9SS type A sorting domain-containing protein [Ferruginibacter sp.]MDB5276711.1 type sorting protein [Ferruginibacter sp.]